MPLALILTALAVGFVAIKNKKAPDQETRGINRSVYVDCAEQAQHPRIQMQNGVVVENWQGQGACADQKGEVKPEEIQPGK